MKKTIALVVVTLSLAISAQAASKKKSFESPKYGEEETVYKYDASENPVSAKKDGAWYGFDYTNRDLRWSR